MHFFFLQASQAPLAREEALAQAHFSSGLAAESIAPAKAGQDKVVLDKAVLEMIVENNPDFPLCFLTLTSKYLKLFIIGIIMYIIKTNFPQD